MSAALVQRYLAVRNATEALAAPLSPEDQQLQSMPSCSPTKWHRAHTAWFFEEFLLGPAGVAPVDDRYRFLFNSYYEAVGPRHPRPRRGMLSRPSCDEIASYRRAVDGRMVELLGSLSPLRLEQLRPLLELGLAHEEQHQELLLTDILHALSQNPLSPAYRSPASSPPEPRACEPARFVSYEGGLLELGSDAGDQFQFDNEGPRHRVWLEPFELSTRPMTAGDLRAFLEADGYHTPSLWLSEGLDFIRAQAIEAPLHWSWERGSLRLFTLDGWVEPHDSTPACHLSYYEADALARFLGARLPTEAEWEAAARHELRGKAPSGHFLQAGWLRPVPGDEQGTDGRLGQLFGDVWEWTSSAYSPYPGFQVAPGAVGEYNGKFMVNQMVLRGGSCFTPEGHTRATYRNFWHPDTRFQMTGARVARSPRALARP